MSQYQLTSNARFSCQNPICWALSHGFDHRPVRFWAVPRYPNYLIVYDPASKPLSIVRILHAARDLARHLEP
jgi:antitoxin ParD1/3/4/toxin ParE1/3/4